MKKYADLLILAMVLAVSCKKENTKSVAPAPSNNFIYGTMKTLITQIYYGDTYYDTDSTAIAIFSTGPEGGYVPAYAGNVKFNGVPLTYNTTFGQYWDLTQKLKVHGAGLWNVSGSGFVPAITYVYSPPHPVFTGNAQLPDSVSLSNGFTVNVGSVADIANTLVAVQLSSNGATVTRTLPLNQISYTFSPADLAGMPSNPDGEIILYFSSSSTQVFGGRQYAFMSVLAHIKHNVKVKP